MGSKKCDKKWRDTHPGNHKHRQHAQRSRIKLKIIEYLRCHPCVDCGERNVIVLDFDHVRGKKEFNIGTSVSSRKCWTKIEEEIKKCDVRCANCHRIKTCIDLFFEHGANKLNEH